MALSQEIIRKIDGGLCVRGLFPAESRVSEKGISNTEGTVADEYWDFVRFRGGIGRGVSYDIGNHIVVGKCCDRYREGGKSQGGESIGAFCGFLIFVELEVGVFVFAAAVFQGHAMTVCAAFGHTALAAVLAVFIGEAPGEEFAHAIVQTDSDPHGGGKVDDS